MEESEEVLDEDENACYVPAGAELTDGAAISSATEIYFYIVPGKDTEGEDEDIMTMLETQGEEENDVIDNLEAPEDGPYALADGTPCYIYSVSNVQGDYNLHVEFSNRLAAIDSIAVDSEAGELEFFNLQGMKVAADNLTPGIYVIRHGETTAKVLVK